ncbi:MAG TPA: DUF488 family protein [Gammaproteobacteria bacterium]|nr:DUF488 family protein [Gammaproteobacteria bacterium]
MDIRIKRVYEPPGPEDGCRVLVDRLWPRGLRKADAAIEAWVRDLAPSRELRKWYGHDPGRWPRFRERYLAELREGYGVPEWLLERARAGTVTLLFAARDSERNNAAVLREHLVRHLTGEDR